MINSITDHFAPLYREAYNAQLGRNCNLDWCVGQMRGNIYDASRPGWKPLGSPRYLLGALKTTEGLDWIPAYVAMVTEWMRVDSARDMETECKEQYGTGLTRGLGT